jgi:AcrR family transcriptional regulator
MRTDKDLKPSPRMERLFKEAAEMFLDQGYEPFSIDSLIEKVGGSKRNVYSLFRGKEGLFIKVMTDLFREITAPLGQLEISELEPEVALKKFSDEVLRLALKPRTLALHRLMIAEAPRFLDLSQAIWKAGHESACKTLEKWIFDQQKNQKLSAKRSAEHLSTQFISMLIGYFQLRALLDPSAAKLSKREREVFIDNTVKSFLLGNGPECTKSLTGEKGR